MSNRPLCRITAVGGMAAAALLPLRDPHPAQAQSQAAPPAPKLLQAHPGGVNSVAFSPDGNVLVSAAEDGSAMLYRVADGSRLATLRAVEDQDAGYVFTREHIDFTGADRCAARVYPICRFGPLTFPIDVCEERVYVKDLLAKVQAGDTSPTEPEYVADPSPCAAASVASE